MLWEAKLYVAVSNCLFFLLLISHMWNLCTYGQYTHVHAYSGTCTHTHTHTHRDMHTTMN